MLGNCALCRNTAPLQKSHYIPKGVIKLLTGPNRDPPGVINAASGAAYPLGSHVVRFLLCASCENKFSRLGESQVIPQFAQPDGRFALRDAFQSGTPDFSTPDGKRIFTGHMMPPGVSGEAYKYFAASMIWRGCVADWGGPAKGSFTELGDEYEEAFRQYLNDEASFPKRALLRVLVDCTHDGPTVCVAPMTRVVNSNKCLVHSHFFTVPGVGFELLTGLRPRMRDRLIIWYARSITLSEWSSEIGPGSEYFLAWISDLTPGITLKGKLAKYK
jgi:hypothetical protein